MANEQSFPSRTPAPVVVLVHGTWGRGVIFFLRRKVATWCDEGSDLRLACSGALGPDTIFYPVKWTGNNSPSARRSAASEIEKALGCIRRDHPGSSIYLIAHSHGGNAAMYCLRDKEQQSQIAGLVCLSTPFLHMRARKFGEAGKRLHRVMVSLTLALTFVALVYWAKPAVPEWASGTIPLVGTPYFRETQQLNGIERDTSHQSLLEENTVEAADNWKGHHRRATELRDKALEDLRSVEEDWNDPSIRDAILAELARGSKSAEEAAQEKLLPGFSELLAMFILFVALFFIMWNFISAPLGFALNKLHSWSHLLANRCRLPDSVPFPVLIIRSMGDEASTALGAPQLFSSIISRVLNSVLRLLPDSNDQGIKQRKPAQRSRLVGIIGTALFSAICIPIALMGGEAWVWFSRIVMTVMLVPITLVAGASVLVYCCIILLCILMMPFGITMALSGASLQITAEGTPPGKWSVVQIGPEDAVKESELGMQHFTHSHRLALEKLEIWLEQVQQIRAS